MTSIQLGYANLLETRRHNVVGEVETNRYNTLVTGETKRHNLSTESLGRATLRETNRHNLATETLSSKSILETVRHNLQTELVSKGTLALAQKTQAAQVMLGRAAQLEMSRHNLATEHAGLLSTNAAVKQATVSQTRASEDKRHNTTSELIAYEQNRITSARDRRNYEISAANTALTRVKNQQQYLLDRERNVETQRHNLATEFNTNLRLGVETATKLIPLITKTIH